jgi:hypothetical protein
MIWFATTLFVYSTFVQAQRIPAGFYGGSWWHSDYKAAPFDVNNIVPPNSGAVSIFTTTGATIMRVGGISYAVKTSTAGDNRTFPIMTFSTGEIVPRPAGYVKIVDDVRAAGFEPALTVPFDDRSKTRSIEEQAIEAADIVRVVNHIHHRNVKYWIIANEPEQSQGYSGTSSQVEQVRRYIRVFSEFMKNMDPTIEIWGPEMEFANPTYFDKLGSSPSIPGSITGPSSGSFRRETRCFFNELYFFPPASIRNPQTIPVVTRPVHPQSPFRRTLRDCPIKNPPGRAADGILECEIVALHQDAGCRLVG